jgi:hypothetical protein
MTIDIRPMIEDVSQVMTKHITTILSGVIGEYTIYKETHDTIMGLPCVRKLQERISDLEEGGGCAVRGRDDASAVIARDAEITQLQTAIAELNRYIQSLETNARIKSEPPNNNANLVIDEESVKLEIREEDENVMDGEGEPGDDTSRGCLVSTTHKNVIITIPVNAEEAVEEEYAEVEESEEEAEEEDAEEEDTTQREEATQQEEATEKDAEEEAEEEAEEANATEADTTEKDATEEEAEEADAEEEDAEEEEAEEADATEADAEEEDAEEEDATEEEAEEAGATEKGATEEEAEEEEAEEEEATEEADATEADATEAEEAEIEVSEVKIKGKTYFTTDAVNGIIYACVDEDVGDEVGVFKNGVAVFNKSKK